MPWWAKMAAKVVLARVPLNYQWFARAGLFRHGQMQGFDYALGVVQHHVAEAGVDLRGKVALELGPGDGLTGGLVARAMGAERVFLVDAGSYAHADMSVYQQHAQALRAAGMAVPAIDHCRSLAELCEAAGLVYLTDGLVSLRQLASESVDFFWSHAVLEHVRHHEFDLTLKELARIAKPGAVASHRIDLQDHLQNSLHNLRFSMQFWERDWMVRSGFYTNRLSHAEICQAFTRAGFTAVISHVDRWPDLPVARAKLAAPFAQRDVDELCIQGFSALLTLR